MSAATPDDPKPSSRIVSVSRFCEMTGRDRDAVTRWIVERGCPVVRQSTTPGEATLVDVRAVCDWREDEIRKEVLRKAGTRDPVTGESVGFKERSAAADARRKELQLASDAKVVVHRDVVGEGFSAALAIFRAGTKDLPEELARDASGLPDDVVAAFRAKAGARVRSLLDELATSLQRTMRAAGAAAAPRLVAEDLDA